MNKVLLRCTMASALGGLLFGYDTVIINGAMADLVRHFQLSPAWQGWTVSSALIGCLLGTILLSKSGDRYGAKLMLQFLAILFFAFFGRMRIIGKYWFPYFFPLYRGACYRRCISSLPGLYF